MQLDFDTFLHTVPRVTYCPAYDPKSADTGVNAWANIRALTYEGAEINGKKTKIFAYIGYPEPSGGSAGVPAVVLVHGGAGHAYAEWVKRWTDRGYAAIAMDNTGFFPSAAGKGRAGREADPAAYWTFGLTEDFQEDGYENAPSNSDMRDADRPLDQQWMYHAVAQTMLAHNILRADSRIDPNRIGITGVSWGGVITSIEIGYDPRWAFAIPIYGSGYLDEALSFMGPNFSSDACRARWLAQDRFGAVRFPVLWLAWNSDNCFSVNSNSRSYLDTKGNNDRTVLSMIHNMQHSHGSAWSQPISYYYADWIVRGGAGLPRLLCEPCGRSVSVEIARPDARAEIRAQIYYLTEPMTYSQKEGNVTTTMDQTWQTAACMVSGNRITGTVPPEACSYYVELTTGGAGEDAAADADEGAAAGAGGGYVTCSSYVRLC